MPEPSHHCMQCGLITSHLRHQATCFIVFQRALLRERPDLLNTVTFEDAERIEARFHEWTPVVAAADGHEATQRLVARRLRDITRNLCAPR